MEHQEVSGTGGLTKAEAVAACTAMAVFYVAILYSPTVLLRLPPPNSFKSFMIRRFACAAVSSVVSLFICSLILPVRRWDASNLFAVYGIRLDHIWQALVFPLVLTSFMYTGSFVRKFLSMLQESNEHLGDGGNLSNFCIKSIFSEFIDWAVSNSSNISSWRNYFVAPLTEELVFRACMIPLLLCGGFSTYTVIFMCPVFFSLGFQLGYTVIFGAYASFLLVRTGGAYNCTINRPYILQLYGLACDIFPEVWDSKCGICNGDVGFLLDAFPFHKSGFV
ncbi:hypothetical protein RD792_014230 [Penstemon davidsonii]|uniref:intramembrane prenyl-peptidase Rce1 n=1 Tax=Penstemon davidsonii TaxID=160366 RepID=A0ABR0CNW8_9LAMI|nr:hypothetical protein RD792_014230 [Penstemon davidsonii]